MLKLWPLYFLIISPFSLKAEQWNFKSNPFYNASKILENKLDLLPQSFEISKLPGTDWNWPLKEGGILNRWAVKKQNDRYPYNFFSYEELKNVDLSQLSPSEKFDLYLENNDWTFSKKIKKLQANLSDSDFKTQLAFSETILKFKNPHPTFIEGKNSLNIPFGSSDIKALLFASVLLQEKTNTKIIGSPCKIVFDKGDAKDFEQCEGLNPGSFHILLTNYIGLRSQGIIVDLKRDKKLELRPVIGFVSNFQDIVGAFSSSASKKTKKEILVTTFIKFIEPRIPKWISEPSSSSRGYESYTYTLELDENNNIIGGTWISFGRPDFVAINQLKEFQGNLKELGSLYNKSISSINDGENKLKVLAQKEIIMEEFPKINQQETLNLMFGEYFENYKNQLTEKRSEKKIARGKLSRELILSKESLIKKIKATSVNTPLKKFGSAFIQLAESNADIKKLTIIQTSFLNMARKNFAKFDLFNIGRLAYLQQKYIDDFSDSKTADYDRLEYIEKSFLMEPGLINQREVLTSNSNFLENANLFF